MFESLDERIKQDEPELVGMKGRIIKYALMAGVAVALFGGLYLALQHLG